MRSPVKYYGGKINMIQDILPLIPNHEAYVEPFFGSGAIFFAKHPSKFEIINDIRADVTNFFRVCKTKYDELSIMIQGTAHSEIEHKRAKEIYKNPEAYTDVEKAWAFWTLTIMSFSSVLGSGFAFSKAFPDGERTNRYRLIFKTTDYASRLENVTIMQRDAIDVIKMFDGENVFFYLDPPYIGADQGHYKGYTEEDFKNLLSLLQSIKGKFLLSSYPSNLLLSFVKDNKWNYKTKTSHIAVTAKTNKLKTECLTYNYEITPRLFD